MEEPEDKSLIPFTPIPLRTRRDGGTVDKQIAFIEALVSRVGARTRRSLNFGNFRGPANPRRHCEHS